MQLLHSVSVQEQAVAADGTYSWDLAVNPLSIVNIALRPLNDTGTLANFASYRALIASLTRVSILYRGESIVQARGDDLVALNYFRHGIQPYQGMHLDTDNFRRCAILPIMMGRFPWDPKSCFPASRRGELVLQLDIDVAATGYDGFRLSVETVEILGAKPSEYEKKVANSQTWLSTNDQDFDLPPGNVNRGVLLFGTTGFTGATPAPSWGRIRVLLDNVEHGYVSTDWEVLQQLHALKGIQPPTYDSHKHRVTTSGDAQVGLSTIGGPYDIGTDYANYAFLDFDPTADDMYALDTRNSSRFHLRANAETADAVRAIPIEVIKVTGSTTGVTGD